MEINFNTQSLFDDLNMKSSFVGKYARDETGSLYDVIKIKSQDRDLVSQLIDESIRQLLSEIHEFVVLETTDVNGCVVTLKDSKYDVSVRLNSISFVKNIAFSKWLMLRYKPEADTYVSYASGNLTELKNVLFTRPNPEKKIWK